MLKLQTLNYINLDDIDIIQEELNEFWDYIVNDWAHTTMSPYDDFGLFYLDEYFIETLFSKDERLLKIALKIWGKCKHLFPDQDSIVIFLGE